MPAEIFELKADENPFYSAVFEGEDYRCRGYVKLKLSEEDPQDDFLDTLVMCAAHFDRMKLQEGASIRFRVASTSSFICMYRHVSAQPDACILMENVEIIRPCVVTELKPKVNPSNRPKTPSPC